MLEDKDPVRTPISSLGEFGLIRHLTETIESLHPSTILGIGDDAAILCPVDKEHQVVSTDILAEGVHFNLGYVPLKHLGYKAAVVNFSDMAAMNAIPRQLLCSLAVSNRFPVEALEEIYAGIRLACKRYQVDLVGGDTTSSQAGLFLSMTVIGGNAPEKLVRRSGAKETDLLVVTGDLGGAYMGLQILEREHSVYLANPQMQPEMEGYEYILERQLKPEARTDIRKILEELDVHPTAMMDISDGLASEVIHISENSGVAFHLYEDKIPLDPQTITTAEEMNLSPVTAALNGGEDYELLMTIPLKDFDKIKAHPDFTIIGHAVEKEQGNYLIASGSNQMIPLNAQGWDAFLNKKTES